MYIWIAMATFLTFDRHWILRADSRARAKTGNSIAARIAMIAITTSSSIRVKPPTRLLNMRASPSSCACAKLPRSHANYGECDTLVYSRTLLSPSCARYRRSTSVLHNLAPPTGERTGQRSPRTGHFRHLQELTSRLRGLSVRSRSGGERNDRRSRPMPPRVVPAGHTAFRDGPDESCTAAARELARVSRT